MGVEPTRPPWQGDRLPLHHGRVRTSGSGGNRTHVHLLKRQAPNQRRTHFRSAGGGGIEPRRTGRRFWKPSAFPDAIPTCISTNPSVPRAGVEPDLCGLKGRRPRPEVQRGVPNSRRPKSEPAGGRFYPRPARVPLHGVPGVIRSYPVPNRDPYSDGPRERPSSRRPRRSLAEVRYSRARVSWLYRVYVVFRVRDRPRLFTHTRGVR